MPFLGFPLRGFQVRIRLAPCSGSFSLYACSLGNSSQEVRGDQVVDSHVRLGVMVLLGSGGYRFTRTSGTRARLHHHRAAWSNHRAQTPGRARPRCLRSKSPDPAAGRHPRAKPLDPARRSSGGGLWVPALAGLPAKLLRSKAFQLLLLWNHGRAHDHVALLAVCPTAARCGCTRTDGHAASRGCGRGCCSTTITTRPGGTRGSEAPEPPFKQPARRRARAGPAWRPPRRTTARICPQVRLLQGREDRGRDGPGSDRRRRGRGRSRAVRHLRETARRPGCRGRSAADSSRPAQRGLRRRLLRSRAAGPASPRRAPGTVSGRCPSSLTPAAVDRLTDLAIPSESPLAGSVAGWSRLRWSSVQR